MRCPHSFDNRDYCRDCNPDYNEYESEIECLRFILSEVADALDDASIGVNVLHHGFDPPVGWTTGKSRRKTIEAKKLIPPDIYNIKEETFSDFLKRTKKLVESRPEWKRGKIVPDKK